MNRTVTARGPIYFFILTAALLHPLCADPEPGLAVRLGYGVGLAVNPPADSGAMERRANIDVDYTLFQFPIITLTAGGMFSRADGARDTDDVVSLGEAHAELSAAVGTIAAADLSIFIRAGAFWTEAAGGQYDELNAAAVGGGLRMTSAIPDMPAVRMNIDLGYTRNYEFRNYAFFSAGFSAAVLRPRPLLLEDLDMFPVFPALGPTYASRPLGYLTIVNRDRIEVTDIIVELFIESAMEEPVISVRYERLAPGGSLRVPLTALLSGAPDSSADGRRTVRVTVTYMSKEKERAERIDSQTLVYGRNALVWDDDRKIASFVTSQNEAVLRIARTAVAAGFDPGVQAPDENLRKLLAVHALLSAAGIAYLPDPASPFAEVSGGEAVDYVQFPLETLERRAGDCDDLSVLYAALLEAAGVPCAFITVPGHILFAVALEGDGIPADGTFGAIEYAGRSWAPFEATMIGERFADAWKRGRDQWEQAGDAKSIFTLAEARAGYQTVDPALDDPGPTLPDPEVTARAAEIDLGRLARELIAPSVRRIEGRMAGDGDYRALNALGVVYARYGLYDEARDYFARAASSGGAASAWENLGNILFLKEDFSGAEYCYGQALGAGADYPELYLQQARAAYELGRYEQAADLFDGLAARAPDLIAGNGYLAGQGPPSDGEGLRGASVSPVLRWRE
jgi:hypothetical protein